ncbi:polymorphic outer membrane protein middle domain-containing protein [Chlamydia sp. 04-14]|uniref:polymorphic outer membrane protein middle domain-containing protein n=1 Tax=Chlamydia TaxID=810 RepID=UPI002FC9CE51
MKSSVPWLLISSAITLPLSSIVAAEEAVVELPEPKVSQPQNGNVNLGPSDNYPGTGGNGSGFTYKETSTEGGTTYTLNGDVSISNVTSTQAPASSNQPEVQSQPQSQAKPEVQNGVESQSSPVSDKSSNSEVDKENKKANSEGDHSSSEPKTEESPRPEVSESSRTEVSPESTTTDVSTESNSTSDTEVSSSSDTETVTTSRILAGILRADATALDSSSSSSGGSQDQGSQRSPEAAQAANKSCFLNTAGPLTFVGSGHSLTFDTITIEAQGAAINNSAGSALTLSGFNNLSFAKSTNQDQTKADSAIYVGPKKTESGGGNGGSVGGVPGVGGLIPENSVSNSASEPNAAANLWTISSDTGAPEIGAISAEGVSGENGIASPKAEEAAPDASAPAIILKGNVNITFSGNSSKKAGGAINVSGGSATIQNNTGTCTFSNNNAKDQGGAVSVTGNFDITGNTTVVFSGNQAKEIPPKEPAAEKAAISDQSQTPATGTGGAIHCLAATDASVPAVKVPEKVVAAATGGVLPSIRAVSLSADSTPAPKQVNAAAAADPCVTISGNTTVTFDNNSSTVSGGAIYAKKLVLSSDGDITFSNNSSGKGGAIFITDNGDISITAATGSITFQGNKVTAAEEITLPAKPQAGSGDAAVSGDVQANAAQSGQAENNVQPQVDKALTAFVTFANKAQVDAKADQNQSQTPTKPSHNAIHLGSGATISQLRAGTGQTIFFYDPITTTKPVAASPGSSGPAGPSGHSVIVRAAAVAAAPGAAQAATPKTPLKINAPDAQAPEAKEGAVSGETKQATYNGTVVFSGEKLTADEAKNSLNAMSVFNTDVSLEAGTLVLRNGAGLLLDSFVQKEGSLIIMDGGTSIITNVPAAENPSSKAPAVPAVPNNVVPVVNVSSKSNLKIISDLVASSLMNFKPIGPSASAPAVSNSQVTNPDGSITITNLAVNLDSLSENKVITLAATGTGNVSITGDLKFQDSSQNFYDNPMLNKNFSANILDISTSAGGKVDTTGFNMIPQGSTSSNVGYQGKWEVTEVKDTNTGKVSFELKWISAGYTPTPNRRATLVPNSLWCSAVDIRAIQQLVEVSTQGEDFHKGIWISGISNFFHRDSMKVQKGFRHISSGYVVGASTQPITDRVIDIAFCQMFGKSKDYHLAKTRSHIYAASIHTKREKLINHYKLSNKKGSILTKLPEQIPVIFDAQLSYSLSHNSMTTKHTPDPSSRGKWNNHCVAGELGSYLPIVIDNPFIEEFSPFMKLHVVFVQQEDFKETKGNANRNFQSAHLVNVSLPIGMKFEKTNKYNIYNISLIYQPDIYRDAPKSKVFLPSIDTRWSTGATNLARQALIIDGCNHHHLTDSFEVFCHGAFELRGSSRNYNLDLGGRYKF